MDLLLCLTLILLIGLGIIVVRLKNEVSDMKDELFFTQLVQDDIWEAVFGPEDICDECKEKLA